MKKRVLCLVLVFVMLLPTMIVPASAYSTGMPQGIQLYVGPRSAYGGSTMYEEYTNDDIAELVGASSEFVMNCINAPINYDLDGNAIITDDILSRMNESYVFHGTSKSALVTSYGNMLDDYASSAATYCNLQVLADAQVELAQRLISEDSSVSIWFCFPVIAYFPCALEYEDAFTDYVNYIKNEMTSSTWRNNVRGFYWATETVGWSATFTSNASSNFGNPHVMLMDAMGDLVKGTYGKEFMWMPYTTTTAGVGLDKNDVRMGYVANRSTIFDYVLLQPGYYWDTNDVECLRRVAASATNNKVYNYSASSSYTNSTVVGGGKVSGAADIGVVMEIDDKIVNGSEEHAASYYNNTYYEYTLKFGSIKSNVPIVFYAGAQPSLMNHTVVFNYVKNFLNY